MHRSIELEAAHRGLAAQARIMRKLELQRRGSARRARAGGWPHDRVDEDRRSMHRHRTVEVRQMARAVHLVRMLIKGIPYHRVERHTHGKIPWKVVGQAVTILGAAGLPEHRNATVDARVELVNRWLGLPRRIAIAPEDLKCGSVQPGTRVVVRNEDEESFEATLPSGFDVFCLKTGCAHLGGRDWTIVDED